MKKIKYPALLKQASKIAITAFSSGVPEPFHQRLDIVIANLRSFGFDVIEGEYLRERRNHVSASKEKRASELMTFLCDDTISAVLPPWGGEFAMDILPLLDYERLRSASPKWIVGFSDVSTILVTLTTKLGWATVHSANLMQLHPKQTDNLTSKTLNWLRKEAGDYFIQHSSGYYEASSSSLIDNPEATFNLTVPTYWKLLDGSQETKCDGRLIGGCLDTIMHIINSEYFDLKAFHREFQSDGIIFYFENAEMTFSSFQRAILGLKYKGIFQLVKGVLIGRSTITSSDENRSQFKALFSALGDLKIPIIYDADIGHSPPNITLFNGAFAEVSVKRGTGKVFQVLKS